MRISAAICGAFLIATLSFGQGDKPKEVSVPDSGAAIKKGEKALIRAFGKKTIESEKPLAAELDDEVWTVHTTLPCGNLHATRCTGGGHLVRISMIDGRVLSIEGFK